MSIYERCRKRISRSGSECGSALLLALIVVLTVGTGLAIALEYTGTGLTLAPSVRDDRNESNYVQGAVEGAINEIRGSTEAGRTDSACPTFVPPVPTGVSGVTGKTFRVTCTGVSTGASGFPDQPRYAIHALSTSAGLGVRHVGGNAELYVNGGIYSNGVVSVAPGAMNSIRVNGTITAELGCGNDVSSTDIATPCSTTASSNGDRPAYLPSIGGSFTLAQVIAQSNSRPTCTNGRVQFPPGHYNESPAVLVLRHVPTCVTNVWHFTPGRYYFDYVGEWALGAVKVVGGSITGSNTGGPGDDWNNTDALGGACDDTLAGVQFVFGGASQVSTRSSSGINTGGLELCGPPSGHTWDGNPQRIVLYGLDATNVTGASSSSTAIITANGSPANSGTASFGSLNRARTIDLIYSDATLTSTRPDAALTYTSFNLPAIPAAAPITKVVLRPSHVFTNAAASITIDTNNMTPLVVTPAANCLPTICDVDITTRLNLTDFKNSLSSLSMVYGASRGALVVDGLARVDGLTLDITYGTPTLSPLTCLNTCTFFSSTSNPNVFMHGTVFTPSADWEVNVHNSGRTIFDRGIVMRDIAITMSASSKQEDSPFQLPQGTPDGRLALFRGYVNNGSGEVEKVRACARYVDFVTAANGDRSAYAGWSMTVPRWLVMRTVSSEPAACS